MPPEQQQCGGGGAAGRGSPLDSAFRGRSPSADALSEVAEEDEAASAASPPHPMQQLRQRSVGIAAAACGPVAGAAADDLDSDSLLHARRDTGLKAGPGAVQQQQQQQPPGDSMPWLPVVTREVLTVR